MTQKMIGGSIHIHAEPSPVHSPPKVTVEPGNGTQSHPSAKSFTVKSASVPIIGKHRCQDSSLASPHTRASSVVDPLIVAKCTPRRR